MTAGCGWASSPCGLIGVLKSTVSSGEPADAWRAAGAVRASVRARLVGLGRGAARRHAQRLRLRLRPPVDGLRRRAELGGLAPRGARCPGAPGPDCPVALLRL